MTQVTISDRRSGTLSPGPALALRLLAAGFILVGGWVHLKLYMDGYKDFPDHNLGRSFLLNVIASVVVAVAVALWASVISRVAGILLAGATLIAFALSRTDSGIFGFTESGWNPSPEAVIAFIAEVGAIVVLVALLVLDRHPRPAPLRLGPALAVGTVAIVVTPILAGIWSGDTSQAPGTASATAPGSVTIANFAFGPQELHVATGATVTWTNTDGTDHSVVANDGAFKSNPLDQNATFSFKFSKAGTYTYICGIHNSMKGTIVVGS